jgi:hypothetical protein
MKPKIHDSVTDSCLGHTNPVHIIEFSNSNINSEDVSKWTNIILLKANDIIFRTNNQPRKIAFTDVIKVKVIPMTTVPCKQETY